MRGRLEANLTENENQLWYDGCDPRLQIITFLVLLNLKPAGLGNKKVIISAVIRLPWVVP